MISSASNFSHKSGFVLLIRIKKCYITTFKTYTSWAAVSEKRLSLTSGGNVRYQLKTPYRESLPHER
jgi:hypothetical protein